MRLAWFIVLRVRNFVSVTHVFDASSYGKAFYAYPSEFRWTNLYAHLRVVELSRLDFERGVKVRDQIPSSKWCQFDVCEEFDQTS